MRSIDVYDFDGTIYRGDSTVDFLLYLVGKRKSLLFRIVFLIPAAIRLLLTGDLTRFKSSLFGQLAKKVDLCAEGEAFWRESGARQKINAWFMKRPLDVPAVIASASPEFELRWIAGEIGADDLICTRVDAKTGQVIGQNCKSSEKIRRIREKYGEVSFRSMYTDSIRADRPLLELAENRYLVNPENGEVRRLAPEELG
ncbi:MAG: haloacid dehalogenase-like hydrolase [Clostridia bacterium]|nr:haloacid dehalogenase-like hydrolase [Clostridia bacterium]